MHECDSHIFALMHIRITCCIYHKYMHKPKHNRNHEGIFGISCRLRQNKQTLHVYGADNAKVIGLIQTWNHRAFWEGCSNMVCMVLGWEILKNLINMLVAGEVPGHFLSSPEVPLSKVPYPELL